ncbi:MAG: xylulokinase [Phycisphaerales bacterium]
MAHLLGIDVGTSSVKVVIVDERGAVRAVASASYPLSRPRPLWSEQDPRDWWTGASAAIREATARARVRGPDIVGVGLSGQMHGSVLLSKEASSSGGRDADPLRPAILWNDQRTGAECARIEASAGGRRALVEMVGNAALPGFTLPKLLWVREHEPGLFRRVAAILLPKDYLRLRLTGELATDVGDASGLLLLDVDRRCYSDRALSLFGIDPSLLPRVVESGEVTGRVTPWAASQTGLAPGTPVAAGSGDNQAGAVGAGVVRPGMVLATLGTSGVIYAPCDQPRKDLGVSGSAGRVHTMCAADGTAGAPGRWCITGCMLSAAGSLQWCLDALWPGETVEKLLDEAGGAPPGSGGLVFLPYMTGERCPYADPLARGGWIGLTSRHTRGHLVRAVIEGVSFGMAQVLDIQRSIGVKAESARVGGGGAKSRLWRQVLADALGVPVATTNTEEGPAFGAALLAGVGAGVWSSVAEACDDAITEGERLEPDAAGAEACRPTRRVFNALYHDLKGRFADLAAADQ